MKGMTNKEQFNNTVLIHKPGDHLAVFPRPSGDPSPIVLFFTNHQSKDIVDG